MRSLVRFSAIPIIFITLAFLPGVNASPSDRDSIVVVYKDGHRQSLAAAEINRIDVKNSAIFYKDGHTEKLHSEIDRIEFGDSSSAIVLSRSHFIGKWEVGDGNGTKFFITLESDGEARKSIGPPHGTWTLIDGEAHISWDDGWHDAIRKRGSSHEKLAFEPGKTFSDNPSNVTIAQRTDHQSI